MRLLEQIDLEWQHRDSKPVPVFYLQHPSHNPAHGAVPGGPPVIHKERLTGLSNLFDYIVKLMPPPRD